MNILYYVLSIYYKYIIYYIIYYQHINILTIYYIILYIINI